MRNRITFLILVVGLVYGQLNYEGNPLTENTEYTAEETYQHPSSKRTSRREQLPWRNTDNVLSNDRQPEGPQKLYPIFEKKLENNENAGTGQSDWSAIETQSPSFKGSVEIASTPLGGSNYDVRESSKKELNDVKFNQGNVQASYQTIGPAELALNNFLNSKTPEESQSYLDYFLRNVQSPASADDGTTSQVTKTQTATLGGNPQQQFLSSRIDQGQPMPEASMMNSPHGTLQSSSLLMSREAVNQAPSSPVLNRPYQPIQDAQPYVPDKSDYMTLPGWRHRTRRLRGGHPYSSFAQPRIAGPAYHFGGPPGPHKSKGPIELIYTKPPGFNSRPPYAGPASAPNTWYPDANYPPPSKDVYWSQLYTQSYDPHYYNYIAKTGKIKPWLYGKLGPKQHEGESMWMELFHGFTKHGLKNIMTPGFLIGMTIPALTLMLGALFQSKGFGRSDSSSNFVLQDEVLRGYTERLQRAIECYERNQNKLRQSNDASDQNTTSMLLLSNCWRTNN